MSDSVQWREWGEAAFKEAENSDKLILLDITASWCHWCHEMDDRTYSDPEVAELINERFVPVRVDTDRRPDINARYNVGGWPTTAVLTPDGKMVTGGTFVPPEQMKPLLERISEVYKERPEEIEERAMDVVEPESPEGELGGHIVDEYRDWLEEMYDEEHGGLGGAPKFPQPNVFPLLFELEGWDGRIQQTLDAMAGGGLFDGHAGGFFRYATSPDWTEPHYEKLLRENSLLLSAYLQAHVRYGEDRYRETAEETLDYLMEHLYDEDGYFYGSQDADEEYYSLGPEEREEAEPPSVDETLYADYNSYAVRALLKASAALSEESYREAALEVLDTVLDNCFDGTAVYHYHPRDPDTPATLPDSAVLLEAVIDAYQHTLDDEYLFRATDVAGAMLSSFGSEGALYDVAKTEERGWMSVRHQEPEDNGQAVRALLKLNLLTEEEQYRATAVNALKDLAGVAESRETFAPQFAQAVLCEEEGIREVTLGEGSGDIQRAVLERCSDGTVVREGEETTVCRRGTCKGPFGEVSEVLEALDEFGPAQT